MEHTPWRHRNLSVIDNRGVKILTSPTAKLFTERNANLRLAAAAPETDALLRRFTDYLQTELLPSIRGLEGGQTLIDAGWNLVAEAHTLRAKATGA